MGGGNRQTEVAGRSSTAPAAPVSAQNPLRGLRRVRRVPMVRSIRQPPLSVPSAMAACAARITHMWISKVFWNPEATSTPVMIPMVFCASLEPWERLKAAAEDQLELAEV